MQSICEIRVIRAIRGSDKSELNILLLSSKSHNTLSRVFGANNWSLYPFHTYHTAFSRNIADFAYPNVRDAFDVHAFWVPQAP